MDYSGWVADGRVSGRTGGGQGGRTDGLIGGEAIPGSGPEHRTAICGTPRLCPRAADRRREHGPAAAPSTRSQYAASLGCAPEQRIGAGSMARLWPRAANRRHRLGRLKAVSAGSRPSRPARGRLGRLKAVSAGSRPSRPARGRLRLPGAQNRSKGGKSIKITKIS